MKSSLLICNGLVIHGDGERLENIRISGEKIIAVAPDLQPGENEPVLDAGGKWIFPGIIDSHTHMGIPIKDQTSADNFETGSRSALNGGVTTIIDFTVLKRNETLGASIARRQQEAEKSHCDVSLHCNFTRFSHDLLKEIPQVMQDGIISFKVFTTYNEAGMMLDYSEIAETAQVIRHHGGLLMVHAEDDETIKAATAGIPATAENDPYSHGLSRPDTAEETAIKALARIAEETECPVYIVHLNSARGLAAAKISSRLLIETCPHYLLLDDSVYRRADGSMFVASPPLRKPEDIRRLWQALAADEVHTLGTDHCPFCRSQKPAGLPYNRIPNGMGGVETLFPVMLAQWLKRGLPKTQLTNLMSARPAAIFGLSQKGDISPGKDADLVIVNPGKISHDWQDRLVSITDWNAYISFPALFPEDVFLRGQHVVKNNELNSLSTGKFIPAVRGSYTRDH
ncbi:MAG: dihydroorotase family protein [Fidelibacterota bacterium]